MKSGMVPISEEEVTQERCGKRRAYCEKSVRVRDEHRVLHVIPQEYAIDYEEGIKKSGRSFRRAYAGESTFDYLPQRYGKKHCPLLNVVV